ncbi:MAG: sel1 repeat family protein [Alphaproteobacteria bacterium]|nr:sel1 repeat family protein [Alphaproteobacteria bacterium]
MHPGLEAELRAGFIKKIPTSFDEVFSTSLIGIFLKPGPCSKKGLNPDHITIEYIFDHCLKEHGFPVVGSGPIRFFLSRPVRSVFNPILNGPYRAVPEKKIIETYKKLAKYSLNIAMQKTLGFWLTRNKHAVMFPLATQGNAGVLYVYALKHFLGEESIDKDIPKAIEYCRDAANLGFEAAIERLPMLLNNYAIMLGNGSDGFAKDFPKSIGLLREAISLGESGGELAQMNLPLFLNNYALQLYNGADDTEKDRSKAISLFREASSLGCLQSVTNLPIFLDDYAAMLFGGRDGVERNITKAVDFCKEAIELGCEQSKEKLFLLSTVLLNGNGDFPKDIATAVDLCKFLDRFGYEKGKALLSEMINAGIVEGNKSIILADKRIEHSDDHDLIITNSHFLRENLDQQQCMLRFYNGQVRVGLRSFFPIPTSLGPRTTVSEIASRIKSSAKEALPEIDKRPDHALYTEDKRYMYDPASISWEAQKGFKVSNIFYSAPNIKLGSPYFEFSCSVFETNELTLHCWGPDETEDSGISPLYGIIIERHEDFPAIMLDGIVDFRENWEKTFSSERQLGFDLSLGFWDGFLIAGAKRIKIAIAPSKI